MTQSDALEILKMGYNVFLTGQPGAGKTYTLNQYIDYLKSHQIEVAVTASTGIAATHIGGTTIHSWSGLGIKKGLNARQLDDLLDREYLVKRLEKARVLVIDEISMLDGVMLDDVNNICKLLRQREEPFGGLQVILVGDFFQLPPISHGTEPVPFAYDSRAWSEANLVCCYLTEQHRQSSDEVFTKLLQELRQNAVSDDSYNELLRTTSTTFDDEIEPVRLFTHNANVDQLNNERLAQLGGEEFTFEMTTVGKANHAEKLIKSCLSPQYLDLRIDAVVMFTKNNFEDGYVNGTMGRVVDIDSETGNPIVETTDGREITVSPTDWAFEDEGKMIASISQIPLRLAWAITVHKSQGMTIDRAEIDLSSTFEYGQGYVALSRVRSLEGLRLLGINDTALLVNPEVLAKDQRFQKLSGAATDRLQRLDTSLRERQREQFIRRMDGVIKAVAVEPAKPIKAKKKKTKKGSTLDQTLALIKDKKLISEIADERGLKYVTVLGHIEQLLEKNKITSTDINYLRPKDDEFKQAFKRIKAAFKQADDDKLSPIMKALDNQYTFEQLRFARLFL
jgi:ATP-dependent DNA helicase PIF1